MIKQLGFIGGFMSRFGADKEKKSPQSMGEMTQVDTKIDIKRGEIPLVTPETTLAISGWIQKQVNTILETDDKAKIRYLLIELVRKNTGITSPTVKIDRNTNEINVQIPGKFKSEGSVSKILIQERGDGKKRKIINNNTLSFGNFNIIFSPYSNDGFDVKLTRSIQSKDMELLRDFFEGVFLNEYMVNEHSALGSNKIHTMLELTQKDLVVFDENRLEVTITLDEPIILNETVLDTLVNSLNNSTEEFSVKSKNNNFEKSILIQDIEKQFKYSIIIHTLDDKMIIHTKPSFWRMGLDRRFIENVLKKIIFFLKNNISTKKSSLRSLRDMGVIVYEKDTENPRTTLEELYMQEGFVGYQDIKDTLSEHMIYPWENREKYLHIAAEEFPHIQNIIPNSALFEWPPGTGKTTQAKIIWKYLGYPFVYIPIAKLMSKWYGESELRLDRIFELARKAGEENGGIIVMIDEIDEIGGNREDSHESTWRLTGILLKKLDGMEQVSNLLLIGSTNRKDSMDQALLSRFSQEIYFRLPNLSEIHNIFSHYLPECSNIAEEMFVGFEGKSGRDISNVAKDIARKYLQIRIVEKQDTTDIKKILETYLLEAVQQQKIIATEESKVLGK